MTLLYTDSTGAQQPVKSRLVSSEHVPAHDVISLPGTVESDIGASKGFLLTLAGAVSSGRVAVDLSSTLATYLQKLSDAFSGSGFNVNLLGTPAANLATLAGAIASARMAVDLAATPLANLATIAGAISSSRMAVDLAATPLANLATIAGAISSSRMQIANSLISTPYIKQVTVGTSAAQFDSTGQVLVKGVVIKADDANIDDIYIGTSSPTVTSSNGFRLRPGQAVPWEIANANIPYGISGTASQKAYMIGG